MRTLLSGIAILISMVTLCFQFTKEPEQPAPLLTIVADGGVVDNRSADEILNLMPNRFCQDEFIGNWEPMECGPREKDLRHQPELFVNII